MRLITTLLAGACLLTSAYPVFAQTYPDRPITVVVPYPPGGATDPIARTFANKLSEAWGVPVIVENKPGAGTTIGMQYVARSKPDGYTVIMGTTSVGTNPALYKQLPYDTVKDFSYLSRAGVLQIVCITNPSVPVKSLAELISYAKGNPGKLNYSSAGNGTITHLAAAFFEASADVDMVHVPYKGSSAAVTAVVSGEAHLTFDTYFTSQPFIKSDRVNVLASAGPKRMESMPNLPTVGETFPGFTAFSWMGFMGPAGMSPEIVEKWSTEVRRIASLPDVKERLAAAGVEAGGTTPAEFLDFVQGEISKWNKVVADANIAKVE
ncbi:MAG: tripartite tricarboxylate transporter substrate binding protein [Burkholderiaceae bacterium]